MNNLMNAMDVMSINGKKAVFTYGKFEPINNTNKELVRRMVMRAKNTGADPYIIVTHTGSGANAKKQKLKEMFPNIPVMATSSEDPKLISVVNRLRKNKDYKNIEMVARSNSVDQFKKFMSLPIFNSGVSRNTPMKKPRAKVTKPKNKVTKTKTKVTKPKSKANPYTQKFKKSDRNVRALEKMMKNL